MTGIRSAAARPALRWPAPKRPTQKWPFRRCAAYLALLGSPWVVSCGALQGPVLASGSDIPGQDPIPVILEFAGNTQPQAELRVAARPALINLSRGQSATAGAADVEFSLEDHYRSLGFPDPEVQVTVISHDGGGALGDGARGDRAKGDSGAEEILVRAEIEEGLRVVVTSLTLIGKEPADTSSEAADEGVRSEFSEKSLLPMWSRRASGKLGFGPPFFVASDLDGFAGGLRSYYRQRGYLAVEVSDPLITAPTPETRTVEIQIEPGPLYRFGTVSVAEPLRERLEQPDLDGIRPEAPRGPFTTRATQEFLIGIRAALRMVGHPYPEVFLQPLPPPTSTEIDVSVLGTPGPAATWGPVQLEGSTRTRESYIRDKLEMREGDRFDGRQLEGSVHRLYQTGLFRTARLTTSDVQPDGTIDGRLELEELPDQSVEFLGGFGSYERVRGGVRFTDRNLFGRGLIGSVSGKLSQRGWRTTAGLTDQDLFGTPFVGNITVEAFEREEPSFTDSAVGGTVSVTRRWLGKLRSRLSYAYFDRSGAEVDVLDPAAALEQYTEGRVTLDLEWDAQDSVLIPRNGYSLRLGVDVQDPSLASDIEIVRLRTAATYHRELTDWLRIGLRAEAGWLFPQNGSANVPLPERFFNGGEDTLRSFREDLQGPLDANGAPVGGEFRNLFSAELRFPLFNSLEFAVFGDAGNVGSRVESYGLSDMRYAIGPGLRWLLPIGPVRLDAGHNPDRRPGEDEWVVFFSVGYPF